MKKIIEINKWEVIQGLQTYAFEIRMLFNGKEISREERIKFSHAEVYNILNSYDDVVVIDGYMIEATTGLLRMQIYKI